MVAPFVEALDRAVERVAPFGASYYQQTSSSGIYFPGAPRTVVAKLGYKF